MYTVFAVFDLEIHNPAAQGQTVIYKGIVICDWFDFIAKLSKSKYHYIWLDWGAGRHKIILLSEKIGRGATVIRLCGLTHYITPRTNQVILGRHREAEAAVILWWIVLLLLTRSQRSPGKMCYRSLFVGWQNTRRIIGKARGFLKLVPIKHSLDKIYW